MTAHQAHIENNILFQQALTHESEEDFARAEQIYKKIVANLPNHIGATLNYANLLIKRNNLLDAIPLYQTMSKLHPEHKDFTVTLGELYAAIGTHSKAIDCYKSLIKLPNPKLRYFHIISNLFIKNNAIEDAISYLFWSLSIDENNYISLISLGSAFNTLEQPTKSLIFFQKAYKLHPDKKESGLLLANTLYVTKKYAESLSIYQAILNNTQERPKILELASKCLVELNRNEDAVEFLAESISLNPSSAPAHYYLGNAYAALGNHPTALSHFENAIKLKDDFAEAKFNSALCNLSLGNLKKGFELYSWRWSIPQYAHDLLNFPYPPWDGSIASNLKLLIWDEQGIGDTIFFAQALRHFTNTSLQITVLCEPRMIAILKRSFPDIEFYPRPKTILPNTFSPSEFDAQIPIGDLNYYGIDFDNITHTNTTEGYLKVDQDTLKYFQSHYKDKITIGINWHTNGKQESKRSIPINQWSDLIIAFPHVTWVNIQYADNNQEFSEIMKAHDADYIFDAKVDPLKDMDMFYSQVQALDAVVSIDNSTAHVAGSLGKPCLLLLPEVHDWRWPLTGEQCIWYNNMTVFRKDGASWTNALEKVRDALGNFLDKASS